MVFYLRRKRCHWELIPPDSFLLVRREDLEQRKKAKSMAEIGEPLRWIMFDESNPYYIKEDVFDHVETTKAFVVYLKAIHNCT